MNRAATSIAPAGSSDDHAVPLRTIRRSGLIAWLLARLLPWRERRHAMRISRRLLSLYRGARRDQPELGQEALHRRIVMEHLRIDERAATALLARAEESFASWPVRRELNLCDIIHYVAFTEFLETGQGDGWIHSDISQTIRACIPQELCISRPRPLDTAVLVGAPGRFGAPEAE